MKILLVANGLPPSAFGGVEVYVDRLAQDLIARGHQVAVFCREANHDYPDGHLITETRHGAAIYRLVNDYKNLRHFRQTFEHPQIEQTFAEILDQVSPDLVHFHHLIALSARLPLLVAERKIPALITLHDYWPICHRVNLLDWQGQLCAGPQLGGDCHHCILGAYERIPLWIKATQRLRTRIPKPVRTWIRRLLGRGDGLPPVVESPRAVFAERYELFRTALLSTRQIIVPSAFVGQVMAQNGYPAEQIRVIPLGIKDTTSYAASRSPQAGIRLAFIGSLLPLKGIDILIQAFRAVKHAKLSLDIYGRDDIIPRFSARLKRLAGRDRRIRFRGAFAPEQRDQIYQSFDVLVIPSVVYETFSMVAREALLMGKPVIASKIGALPEVIQDQVNGYLVEPGSISGWTQILQKVADYPALLDALEIPGPVEIVPTGAHTTLLENLYRDLVNKA